MKSIFVIASLLLLCTAAFAVEVETSSQAMVSSEIQFTLESMSTEAESQALVSQLTAQAQVAHSTQGGVERLIGLIEKVLARLLRQSKRRGSRNQKNTKACKQAIKVDKAMIASHRSSIKVKSVKLSIAQNVVKTSGHESSRLQRKAADHSQAATREEERAKRARSDSEVRIARSLKANEETAALIKLLKLIDSKLTNNGLAEIQSELSSAAKANAKAEVVSMLELAADKARAGDVQDVHDLITMLIKQLEAEIQQNTELIATEKKVQAQSAAASAQSIDAERANAKLAVKQQDETIKRGDRARARILVLTRKIKAHQQNIKSTRAHLKSVRSKCKFERSVFARKQKANRKQIRVLRQVIAMLKSQKTSQQVAGLIKDVKLDLPLWKKGAWSSCSKSCGVGIQTRSVSCSAGKCLGFKPRSKRMCNKGACKSDCILTQWSAWSKCSKKCGGGIKQRTRKILALAVNGGKACPASVGLIQKRACNKKCSAQVDEFAADSKEAAVVASGFSRSANSGSTRNTGKTNVAAAGSANSAAAAKRRRLRQKMRKMSSEVRKLREGLKSGVYKALSSKDRQAALRRISRLQRRINSIRRKLGMKLRKWKKIGSNGKGKAKRTLQQRIAKLKDRSNKLRALTKKLKAGIKTGEYAAMGKKEIAKARARLNRASRRLRRTQTKLRNLKALASTAAAADKAAKKAANKSARKAARKVTKKSANKSAKKASNGGRRRRRRGSLRRLIRRLRRVKRAIKKQTLRLNSRWLKKADRPKALRKLKQLKSKARSLKNKVIRRRIKLNRRFGKLKRRANRLKRMIRRLKRDVKNFARPYRVRARLDRVKARLGRVQKQMRRVFKKFTMARRVVGNARLSAPRRGNANRNGGGRGGRRQNIIRRAARATGRAVRSAGRAAGRAVRSVGRSFRRRG